MTFQDDYRHILSNLMKHGTEVEVGQWQSQDVSNNPEMVSRELLFQTFYMPVPESMELLQHGVTPNLPWAEDHFQERVSGEPLNPPPSEAWWPFRVNQNALHKQNWEFSHTYPERMWPRYAADLRGVDTNQVEPHKGLRFYYGDLADLVNLLTMSPLTRQAFLPIWFPEDLNAAVHQHRVPCTLGYHFIYRQGKLNIVYYIRSCDLLRHFNDDVYMAARLLQWVVGMLRDRSIKVQAGTLLMHITSLHIFRGDYERVALMQKQWQAEEDEQYGAPV